MCVSARLPSVKICSLLLSHVYMCCHVVLTFAASLAIYMFTPSEADRKQCCLGMCRLHGQTIAAPGDQFLTSPQCASPECESRYVSVVTYRQVLYYPDMARGVQNLLDGLVEVIFTRADRLPGLAADGQVDISAFKVVAQVCTSNFHVLIHIYSCYCGLKSA